MPISTRLETKYIEVDEEVRVIVVSCECLVDPPCKAVMYVEQEDGLVVLRTVDADGKNYSVKLSKHHALDLAQDIRDFLGEVD